MDSVICILTCPVPVEVKFFVSKFLKSNTHYFWAGGCGCFLWGWGRVGGGMGVILMKSTVCLSLFQL